MARPQTMYNEEQMRKVRADIGFASMSGMTAQDLTPTGWRQPKSSDRFCEQAHHRPDRRGDLFRESFTRCPVTTDHQVLISAIGNIRNGLLEDGTAIGSGLGTSVDRLRESKTKSKIIILLTDGENNGGLIDPQTAKGNRQGLQCEGIYDRWERMDMPCNPVNTPMGVVMQQGKKYRSMKSC